MRALTLILLLLSAVAHAQAITPYPCAECTVNAAGVRLSSGGLSTDGGIVAQEMRLGPSAALGECTQALWYTQRRYNAQCWECNPILQAIGGPAGAWTYCGTPYIPFSSRSLVDPQGSGTPAGVLFDSRNPGTHYTQLGELSIAVEEVAGLCSGGGCPAGTHAIIELVQRNAADGGYRVIGIGRIPCTAPVNYCVSTRPTAFNGCTSDAGIWAAGEPETLNGRISYAVRSDGGQCSTFGVYRVTGWGLPFAQGDGGGS